MREKKSNNAVLFKPRTLGYDELDHITLNKIPSVAFIFGIKNKDYVEQIKMLFVNDRLLYALDYLREEMEASEFCFFSKVVHKDDADTIPAKVALFKPVALNHVERIYLKLKTRNGDEITIIGDCMVSKWTSDGKPVEFLFTGSTPNGNIQFEEFYDKWSKEQKRQRIDGNHKSLTEIELNAHNLCILAKTQTEIAEALYTSVGNVKKIKVRIFRKLNVNSVPEMIIYAVKCGWN